MPSPLDAADSRGHWLDDEARRLKDTAARMLAPAPEVADVRSRRNDVAVDSVAGPSVPSWIGRGPSADRESFPHIPSRDRSVEETLVSQGDDDARGRRRGMMDDPDVKTRVTPLEELRAPRAGLDCMVVIYSSDARVFGKRFVLERETLTMGRGQENVITLDNDSVSRRHCRIERRGTAWYVVDLDSTNGTYVNDELVKEYQLRRGDQVKIGDTILKYLSGSDVEAQYHETIYKMTIVDGLTQVHNKRYLLETLDREIPRARRHGRPLSALMFDIDHFKKINDTFGHLAGDYVLKEMATLVKSRLRPDDVFGRYGGEEFCALLPETPLVGAGAIAEDLRRRVQERKFAFENEQIAVTVSIGCAELGPDMDVTGLVKAADEKLYASKHAGRNRVSI